MTKPLEIMPWALSSVCAIRRGRVPHHHGGNRYAVHLLREAPEGERHSGRAKVCRASVLLDSREKHRPSRAT